MLKLRMLVEFLLNLKLHALCSSRFNRTNLVENQINYGDYRCEKLLLTYIPAPGSAGQSSLPRGGGTNGSLLSDTRGGGKDGGGGIDLHWIGMD